MGANRQSFGRPPNRLKIFQIHCELNFIEFFCQWGCGQEISSGYSNCDYTVYSTILTRSRRTFQKHLASVKLVGASGSIGSFGCIVGWMAYRGGVTQDSSGTIAGPDASA